MKKTILITALTLTAAITISFAAGKPNISFGSQAPFSPEQNNALILENEVILKKNSDKTFESADSFLSKKFAKQKTTASETLSQETILYKDLGKKVNVKDRMNWVDPERQVYLIVTKHDEFKTRAGTFTNAKVYQIYDAETGQLLSTNVSGDSPKDFIPPNERFKK